MTEQRSRVVYTSKDGTRIVGCGLPEMPPCQARAIVDGFNDFAKRIGGAFAVETAEDHLHVHSAAT